MAATRQVILWPDTFNNYFHPATARAAVEVLEAAGCGVSAPTRDLCCGRPLYDYGFLDKAKRRLRQIVDELRSQIEEGVPVVGLEPSCVSVFRDELTGLFPHDQDTLRLSKQTFTLGERFQLPRADRTNDRPEGLAPGAGNSNGDARRAGGAAGRLSRVGLPAPGKSPESGVENRRGLWHRLAARRRADLDVEEKVK
jgi:hypothetical protein